MKYNGLLTVPSQNLSSLFVVSTNLQFKWYISVNKIIQKQRKPLKYLFYQAVQGNLLSCLVNRYHFTISKLNLTKDILTESEHQQGTTCTLLRIFEPVSRQWNQLVVYPLLPAHQRCKNYVHNQILGNPNNQALDVFTYSLFFVKE